jgi:hypothetical protein
VTQEASLPTPRDLYVSQREFDQLVRRVDQIDDVGTRGVVVLQTQMTDVARDLAKIEASMDLRFKEVDGRFERATQDRVSTRRWLIGSGIAGASAIAAILAALAEILTRLH